MWAQAAEQYRYAKLDNGKTVDDTDRVVQEAVATYVGHRAAHAWMAWDKVALLNTVLDKFEAKKLPADRMRQIIDQVLIQGTITGAYNRAMLERVFGYQMVSGNQVSVASEPIPDPLSPVGT